MGEDTYMTLGRKDSGIVRAIKRKLDECGGKAVIKLARGGECQIWYSEDKKELLSDKIPVLHQLTWETFDAAVEVARMNGGKAQKGQARSGAKVGSEKLSLDSVEGYVAHKVHGVEIGKSAFGPGFVICAILEWAGIAKNGRGCLELNKEWL